MSTGTDERYKLELRAYQIVENEDFFKSLKSEEFRELRFLFHGITKQLLEKIENLEGRVEYLEERLATTLMRLQD